MIPPKLQKGDNIRVIAPARSLAMRWINNLLKQTALQRFRKLGLNVSFGKHVCEIDEFDSSSIQSRISDLHEAFLDQSIKIVIAAIGGFNSNQLLRYLDYELIKANPKILCGYSDITALATAIYVKTGIVTYSSPNFLSLGDKKGVKYTLDYFEKCLFSRKPFIVEPSKKWSDDKGTTRQKNKDFIPNEGYQIINEGKAKGRIVGGNLCTLNLLHGTEFMPDLRNSILFLEDDYESLPHTFDRDFQSLIHQPGFEKIKGIVFGRFQLKSKMNIDLLGKIVHTKKELRSIPIISNIDFGHTTPQITFPIGGTAEFTAQSNQLKLRVTRH